MDLSESHTTLVYVASESDTSDAGIYVYKLDMETGGLQPYFTVTEVAQTQFITFDPTGRYLYASGKADVARINAFAVDEASGHLTYLNNKATGGESPCYVSVTRGGRFVLVANYRGASGRGNIAMFPLLAEGYLGERTDVLVHDGSGPDPDRQDGSHPHMVVPDPSNKHVLVSDLGTDRVMVYRLDTTSGRLRPHIPAFVAVAGGAGPRHMDFHPTLPYMYLINELNNTMVTFRYDLARGTLQTIQTLSTLPEDYEEEVVTYKKDPETGTYSRAGFPPPENAELMRATYCADVHVAPSGRFVYGSNRGHNSIVIYAVDEETGQLSPVGHQSTKGDWPRGFHIDPSGKFLIVGNQWSHDVFTFRIDEETGKLSPTGQRVEVPGPICIQTLNIPDD